MSLIEIWEEESLIRRLRTRADRLVSERYENQHYYAHGAGRQIRDDARLLREAANRLDNARRTR